MTLPVTTVTTRARSADTLSDQDYRDIYTELRSKCPLRQFADLIHSAVSFAWWSKYERGEASLSRERRNELRAAVGLPALPPTVADASARADPDATVYQVGQQAADRLILVGADVREPLTLRINGSVSTLPDPVADLVPKAPVTPVTAHRTRPPRSSIVLYRSTWESLNAARLRNGQTWDQFLAGWVGQLTSPAD